MVIESKENVKTIIRAKGECYWKYCQTAEYVNKCPVEKFADVKCCDPELMYKKLVKFWEREYGTASLVEVLI